MSVTLYQILKITLITVIMILWDTIKLLGISEFYRPSITYSLVAVTLVLHTNNYYHVPMVYTSEVCHIQLQLCGFTCWTSKCAQLLGPECYEEELGHPKSQTCTWWLEVVLSLCVLCWRFFQTGHPQTAEEFPENNQICEDRKLKEKAKRYGLGLKWQILTQNFQLQNNCLLTIMAKTQTLGNTRRFP